MNLMSVCVFVVLEILESSFQRSLKALSCTCWVKLICQVATGIWIAWAWGFFRENNEKLAYCSDGHLCRRKWRSQIRRYLQKHASCSEFSYSQCAHHWIPTFGFWGPGLLTCWAAIASSSLEFQGLPTGHHSDGYESAQNNSDPVLPEAHAITHDSR